MTTGNRKTNRNHLPFLYFIFCVLLSKTAFAGNLSEIYELSVANDPELAAAQLDISLGKNRPAQSFATSSPNRRPSADIR